MPIFVPRFDGLGYCPWLGKGLHKYSNLKGHMVSAGLEDRGSVIINAASSCHSVFIKGDPLNLTDWLGNCPAELC